MAVLDRLVILLPDVWVERRDRGLTWAELGRTDQAAADVASYLEHVPQAADAPALRRRLLAWQAGPGAPSQ